MEKEYFVLYKRDMKTEKTKMYREKMLFDYYQEFAGPEEAKSFAFLNLPCVLAKRDILTENIHDMVRDKKTPYVVAAKHYGKYKHYDYGGGCDYLETYDAVRCSADALEGVVEKIASEDYIKEIIVGLELRLL